MIIATNREPLPVFKNLIIGNSPKSVNEISDKFNVKEISLLSGVTVNAYGTYGGYGEVEILRY